MAAHKKRPSFRALITALFVPVLIVVGAVTATSALPADAEMSGKYACVHSTNGTLFLRFQCKPGERRVLLGSPGLIGPAGQTGPAGPAGPAGSGATGPSGPAGAPGLAGAPGANGTNGTNGTNGVDGADGFIPAYGSFIDTSDQLNTLPNAANRMFLNQTLIGNRGVTIADGGSGNSRIVFEQAGTYNIQFSVQLYKNSNETSEQLDIWLSTEGVSVPYSDTQVLVVSTAGKVGKGFAAWNFLLTVEAGEYAEIFWISEEPSIRLEAVAAINSPAGVAVPSVILTVTQVG